MQKRTTTKMYGVKRGKKPQPESYKNQVQLKRYYTLQMFKNAHALEVKTTKNAIMKSVKNKKLVISVITTDRETETGYLFFQTLLPRNVEKTKLTTY